MAVLPRTARAQDDFDRYINAVVQLYASGESERALEQLERARLRSWEVEQDVLVELYEGLILLDLGQWEQALGAFEAGLLLDPEARLPAKVSPKVSDAFEAVREQVQKKLARGAEQPGDPPVKPKLEPSAPPPPKPFDPKPEVVEQARSRVPVVPLVLAGVGVTAAAVGAVFGLQSRSKAALVRDAYEGRLPASAELPQLSKQLDEAHSHARRANVLFGAAALSVGGAIVTWLLASDDSAEESKGGR